MTYNHNQEKLLKAIAKTGAVITNESHRFTAIKGSHQVTWFTQKDYKDQLSAVCIKCKRVDDIERPEYDEYCGFFANTIKSAAGYLML